MMEGHNSSAQKVLNKMMNHPHITIFCLLLLVSLSFNTVMISSMGFSSFIDSYANPNEYVLLDQDQLINENHQQNQFAVIVQKQSHPLFSTDSSEQLCFQHTQGRYIIHSQTTQSYSSTDQNQVIGKVVSIIPQNPLSTLSCLWWQKTNQVIQNLKT